MIENIIKEYKDVCFSYTYGYIDYYKDSRDAPNYTEIYEYLKEEINIQNSVNYIEIMQKNKVNPDKLRDYFKKNSAKAPARANLEEEIIYYICWYYFNIADTFQTLEYILDSEIHSHNILSLVNEVTEYVQYRYKKEYKETYTPEKFLNKLMNEIATLDLNRLFEIHKVKNDDLHNYLLIELKSYPDALKELKKVISYDNSRIYLYWLIIKKNFSK